MAVNGFAPFVAATSDAAANQTFFTPSENEKSRPSVSRALLRLNGIPEGEANLCLWYSNALDSTFGPGKIVLANTPCGEWDILEARAWVLPGLVRSPEEAAAEAPDSAARLTFQGSERFHADPGAVFRSDPFPVRTEGLKDGKNAATLVLDTTFSFQGEQIPYHRETLIPVLRKDPDSGAWVPDVRTPLPAFTGVEKKARTVGFLGDSVTQGIGAGGPDCAFPSLVQDGLGPETAVWNLGIGYARAADVASGGFWMLRAAQNDVVCVCLGLNDIEQGYRSEEICANLKKIVLALRGNGCEVILLTPPPFDFTEGKGAVWEDVVFYCDEELSRFVKAVVRTDRFLGVSPERHGQAKYGPHPNAEGHRKIADELLRIL